MKIVLRDEYLARKPYGPSMIAKLSADPDGFMTETELDARLAYFNKVMNDGEQAKKFDSVEAIMDHYESMLASKQMKKFDELDAVATWKVRRPADGRVLQSLSALIDALCS